MYINYSTIFFITNLIKTMKLKFLILGCIFFTFQLQAQKAKFKSVGDIKYLQAPNEVLGEHMNTVAVTFQGGSNLMDIGYTEQDLINQHFSFLKYKNVPSGAHLNLEVELGYFYIESSKTETTTTSKKRKDGTKYNVYSYHKNIIYSMPIAYKLVDYQGNVMEEGVQISRASSTYKYKPSGTKSYSDIRKKWDADRNSIKRKLASQHLSKHLGAIANKIRTKYDYSQQTVSRAELGLIKDKKANPNKHEEMFEAAEKALKSLDPTTPINEEQKQTLLDAIAYWDGQKDNYSPSDKKTKKAHYACLLNNAILCYWLDDFTKAEEYIALSKKVDIEWREKEIAQLESDIALHKDLFALNGVNSRHMAIYPPDNASPPSGGYVSGTVASRYGGTPPAAPVAEAAATPAKIKTYRGFVFKHTGDKLEGEFRVDETNSDALNFTSTGNVIFAYESRGESAEMTMNPEKIASFTFNGRNFKTVHFSPFEVVEKNPDLKNANQIMEVLYDSPAIMVYNYFPYAHEGQTEIAYQKAGEKDPVSLNDLQFMSINKGLAEYFKDCPALVEKAITGEYRKQESDLIKAAYFYATSCKK